MSTYTQILFVGCCLIGTLTACQTILSDDSTSFALPTPATPNALAASGITGSVVAASDVAGQPDQPLARQLVAAIPLALASNLPGSPADPLTDRDLRFLAVTVEAPDPRITTTLSAAQGSYSLTLPPGAYALCLAEPTGAQAAAPPFATRGCGRVTVEPGVVHSITISSGLGEIVLVEP
jgi:hypothetical protein